MKKLEVALGFSILAYMVWHAANKPAQDGEAEVLFDRIWIDHIPKTDKEEIQVFSALSERLSGFSIGMFEVRTQWRGSFEMFRYEDHGERLRLVFPQSGDREMVTARAHRCDEAQMDFCLEVEGASRGAKR